MSKSWQDPGSRGVNHQPSRGWRFHSVAWPCDLGGSKAKKVGTYHSKLRCLTKYLKIRGKGEKKEGAIWILPCGPDALVALYPALKVASHVLGLLATRFPGHLTTPPIIVSMFPPALPPNFDRARRTDKRVSDLGRLTYQRKPSWGWI